MGEWPVRILLTVLTAAFGSMLTLAGANAAPQTLLLVAQGDDLQFRCAGEHCLAEATALCLQYERATPTAGTPYEPVDEERYGTGRPNGLALIGESEGGEEKSLPLDTMTIVSERGHMAVRFSVPRSVLSEKGLKAVKLRVAHNVVLEPVWQVGDAHPQRDDDLALSVGPLRATAEATLNREGPDVVAAQILRDKLNALPRGRVASVDERKSSLDRAIAVRLDRPDSKVSQEALDHARQAAAACGHIQDQELWYRAFHTRISRYRDCIGSQHDKLIKDVNETYWDVMKGAGT